MLVLQRRERELRQRIRLELPSGEYIWIQLIDADRGFARFGIEAPDNVIILREELIGREANREKVSA